MIARIKSQGSATDLRNAIRLMLLLPLLGTFPAWAINKCERNGQTVYQDTPCESDRQFVARAKAEQARIERLHQKLDELAAQGQGLPTPTPATPPAAAEKTEGPEYFVPDRKKRSKAERKAEREAENTRWVAEKTEEARAANERSAARLNGMLDNMNQSCGKQMAEKPKVGMSDATFRNCTLHARFGGITQLVAANDGNTPLRLYIFSNSPHRVYAVDSVITAIKP